MHYWTPKSLVFFLFPRNKSGWVSENVHGEQSNRTLPVEVCTSSCQRVLHHLCAIRGPPWAASGHLLDELVTVLIVLFCQVADIWIGLDCLDCRYVLLSIDLRPRIPAHFIVWSLTTMRLKFLMVIPELNDFPFENFLGLSGIEMPNRTRKLKWFLTL